MNKNTILIVIAIVIIVLGSWFYFMPPANAPVIPNNTTGTNDVSMPPVENDVVMNNGAIKSITVTGENFSFSPSVITVRKGDTVKVTFKSTAGMHDFKIDEFNAKTQVLRATDAEEVIQFVADKAGSFEYYCSVGNHRQMGMRGTFVVTE